MDGGQGQWELRARSQNQERAESTGQLALRSVGLPEVPLSQGVPVRPDETEEVRGQRSGSRSSQVSQDALTFSPVSPGVPVSPRSP
jgi:hypothetical protein